MTEAFDKRYRCLKDHRLPEILINISKSGKTGILHLKNWPAEKLIYIRDGNIVFASSNIEDDCLGIHLLKNGKIKVVQYYESIRLIEKTNKRHGAILIELGYLTQKDVDEAIKKQVEDIIFSIFNWEHGYFFFEESPLKTAESILIGGDTVSFIYKGIKKMDSFPQIRNAMPLVTVLTLSPDADSLFEKLILNEKEKMIIQLVDGKKSVLDILTSLHSDDLETLKLLYALHSVEAAVPVDYRRDTAFNNADSHEALYQRGAELLMSGNYNESIKTLREAADIKPDNASCHFYLAISLMKSSMLEEAETSLKKAIDIEPFNDDYHVELGAVYSKKGFIEKAAKTLEFALRINPHNESAQRILSEIKKEKRFSK